LFGTLCKVLATLSYPNVAGLQVREGLGRWPIFHSFQPTYLPCDLQLKCQKVLKIGPLTYQPCDGYLQSQKVLRRDASLDAYSILWIREVWLRNNWGKDQQSLIHPARRASGVELLPSGLFDSFYDSQTAFLETSVDHQASMQGAGSWLPLKFYATHAWTLLCIPWKKVWDNFPVHFTFQKRVNSLSFVLLSYAPSLKREKFRNWDYC
jgi:hypothetical protein